MKNEMKGILWQPTSGKENGPILSGFICVSGTELRLTVWPKQKPKSGEGKQYFPCTIEYGKDEIKRLIDVTPQLGAIAQNEQQPEAEQQQGASDDLPF